ncbi:MAG TPA: hypothetical protein VKZ53_18990 [Candidatus Angelobacter sp.]|nr:hypothetical protein [Candidatus Angelobacter sp.]
MMVDKSSQWTSGQISQGPDPDTGHLIFLELNTSPMFARFNVVSEGRISTAMVRELMVRELMIRELTTGNTPT